MGTAQFNPGSIRPGGLKLAERRPSDIEGTFRAEFDGIDLDTKTEGRSPCAFWANLLDFKLRHY
jgi:hypothetical protein